MEADAAAGLGSAGELQGVNAVDLIDSFTGVMLTIESGFQQPCGVFRVHGSLSESGFEKIYQGSCLAFLFDLSSSDGLWNLITDSR